MIVAGNDWKASPLGWNSSNAARQRGSELAEGPSEAPRKGPGRRPPGQGRVYQDQGKTEGTRRSSREYPLTVLRREHKTLIEANEIVFLAHALVVPTDDPEDEKRFDAAVEAILVKVAWAFEEAAGGALGRGRVQAALARAAGKEDSPGFRLALEPSRRKRVRASK